MPAPTTKTLTDAEKFELDKRLQLAQTYAYAYHNSVLASKRYWPHWYDVSESLADKREFDEAMLSDKPLFKVHLDDGVYAHRDPKTFNGKEILVRVTNGFAMPEPYPSDRGEGFTASYQATIDFLKAQGTTTLSLDWGYQQLYSEDKDYGKAKIKELEILFRLAGENKMGLKLSDNVNNFINSLDEGKREHFRILEAQLSVNTLGYYKEKLEVAKAGLDKHTKLAGADEAAKKADAKAPFTAGADFDAKMKAVETALKDINNTSLEVDHVNKKLLEQMQGYDKALTEHGAHIDLHKVESDLSLSEEIRNDLFIDSDATYKDLMLRNESIQEWLEAEKTRADGLPEGTDAEKDIKQKELTQIKKLLTEQDKQKTALQILDPAKADGELTTARNLSDGLDDKLDAAKTAKLAPKM